MKRLLFILLLLPCFAFAQPCADEDTVRSNSATLITYNSARINGSISHFSGSFVAIYLKYVRAGQTDTATSSGVTPLRNLTGLQASTLYYYYYSTVCVSGTNNQLGSYSFTTAANTILYAFERPTYFNYVKHDSGFKAPRTDTSLYRAPNTSGGDIVFKTSDSKFYGYNGTQWLWFGVDSAGIMPILNDKVDSVTVEGDSLFYWKLGVSYGEVFPPTASVDSITRTEGIDSIYFWRSGTVYAVKDSVGSGGGSTDTTSLSNRINLKVNISDTAAMLSPYINTAGWGLTKSSQILTVDTSAGKVATKTDVGLKWDKSGNAGTTAGTNFIGTTDAQDFVIKTGVAPDEIMRFSGDGLRRIDMGLTNTASGTQSLAIGESNTASGYLSTAIGYNNTASFNTSFALGFSNISSGDQTFSLGKLNTASGSQSFAIGISNITSGIQSVAIGSANIASNDQSFAVGLTDTASGRWSTALGGESKASADYAFAQGHESKATGVVSIAMGNGAVASGYGTISLGKNFTNAKDTSFAVGYTTRKLEVSPDSVIISPTLSTLISSSNVRLSNLPTSGTYYKTVRATSDGSLFLSDTAASTAINIYNSDGTITGSRTVNGGGNDLLFSNNNSVRLRSGSGAILNEFHLDAGGGAAEMSSATGFGSSGISVENVSGISLTPHTGLLYIDTLTNAVGTHAMRYDPTTGLVSYADTTTATDSNIYNSDGTIPTGTARTVEIAGTGSLQIFHNGNSNEIHIEGGSVQGTGDIEINAIAGNLNLTSPTNSVVVITDSFKTSRNANLIAIGDSASWYMKVRNRTSGLEADAYWPAGGGGSMVYPGAGIALSTGSAWSTSITDNSANWNTAYTDRLKWDGGATGLTASTGRTSLGGTTVGQNIFTLTDPGAITFLRMNADNTVDARSATNMRSDLGLVIGTDVAPVASPTFTGTVTIPTPFTLGATSVTSTGTQLNYLNAATGTTGTASTNLVFSTSPLFVTPRLNSTSTTGHVWTATDASGNGSFQAPTGGGVTIAQVMAASYYNF